MIGFSLTAVIPAMLITTVAGAMLVQLLGSIRALEFMAFTGNTGQSNSHKKQGKEFHRRAS